jgi:hypothetical protein
VQRLIQDGHKLNTESCVDKFQHVCDDKGMIDFNTLLNSENIIISQSSFSWWAAFLGEHKRVIFPFCRTKGMWNVYPKQDDVDLYYENGVNRKIIYD